MVEDVVDIGSQGICVHAGELFFLYGFRYIVAEPCNSLDREISRIAYANEVKSQHTAVKTEVEFRCFYGGTGVNDIKCVAQEKPAPTEIWADFERWRW